MQVINEDQYTQPVYYGAGGHTLSREMIGTRYAGVAVRVLVDARDKNELEQIHSLQDAIKVTQQNPGTFQIPNWDEASRKKVQGALLQLGTKISDTWRMYGANENQVDPVRHVIGSAMLWGGAPEKDALYLPITPERNDGTTIYGLSVKDVPVDGFWSLTVYNSEGYIEPNKYEAYSVNSYTAIKGPDGSTTIQFGGCDGKIPNCLPIMSLWNYTVRLFRPRPEILSGKWKFPLAAPESGVNPKIETLKEGTLCRAANTSPLASAEPKGVPSEMLKRPVKLHFPWTGSKSSPPALDRRLPTVRVSLERLGGTCTCCDLGYTMTGGVPQGIPNRDSCLSRWTVAFVSAYRVFRPLGRPRPDF